MPIVTTSFLLADVLVTENISANSEISLENAISIMQKNGYGTLVLTKARKPISILTESNIVQMISPLEDLKGSAIRYGTSPVITIGRDETPEVALEKMLNLDVRRVVVIDKRGSFKGVVFQDRLLKTLESDVYRVALKIGDLIHKKKPPVTVSSEISLNQALDIMRTHKIGSLITVEGKKAIGIVTERDLLEPISNSSSWDTPISLYMSSPVITIGRDSQVTDAITIMEERKIRHLLVVNPDDSPRAVFTNRDIMLNIKGSYSYILETKLRYAKEVMNSLPEAILEIKDGNKEQRIQWLNTQSIRMFGKESLDKCAVELFGKKSWNTILKRLYSQKEIANISIMLGDKNYEVSGFMAPSIGQNTIKLILKDITEHVKTKEKLKKQVQIEIGRRVEKDRLLLQQSKLVAMGEMVANIAHQWRQPLSELSGIFMNLSARKKLGKLNDEIFFEKIEEGSLLLSYMSSTIEDFRNFYSIKQKYAPFQLEHAYHKAVKILEASMSYFHIDIEAKCTSIRVFGDENQLAQALLNILSNARDILSKKEPEDRTIWVSIERSEKDALIFIEDNGGGIELSPIKQVFEPYITTKEIEEGSGIGLYMSKSIIERMGGKISASNTKRGALFKIVLPVYEQDS